MSNREHEPMLDLYLFETNQMLTELEQIILESEKSGGLDESINEIFRIMHTIKGSSAMMLFNNIAEVAHKVEDLFALLREKKPKGIDYGKISDLVLEAIDFFKLELAKLNNGEEADGKAVNLLEVLQHVLGEMGGGKENRKKTKAAPAEPDSQKYYILSTQGASTVEGIHYQAGVKFSEECDMLDVRAMSLIGNLEKIAQGIQYHPPELLDNDEAIDYVKEQGLLIDFFAECTLEEAEAFFQKTPFLADLQIKEITETEIAEADREESRGAEVQAGPETVAAEGASSGESEVKRKDAANAANAKQNMISVNLNKLDMLMDLVGELVIAEAMVTRHPELEGLPLENFHKSAIQLRKLTKELQDVVMSVRMVPLAATFQKMNRIVRDMNRSLGKDVQLLISGSETEVDKNIIEHVSDPLMHLIRNSLDHGIETAEERSLTQKPGGGTIWLEARNAGGDVLITIKDDGRGLNKEKILEKAKQKGLLKKNEQEMTDKEIYALILLPGFSTKEQVTEYSGRGVGMDVVCKGIEVLGGKVLIDSVLGVGTTITLKIPLTLAIIDGMTIKVGASLYTVPTTSIRESFRMRTDELITDSDGNEMILNRGECYPMVRLYQRFGVPTQVTAMEQGIVMMVENNESAFCLFADELLGEQQVVVKALPNYIRRVKGIAGCTLLGNGDISLILDVAGLE